MMETITSPYLEAVQAIPGSTPSEKHKKLNSIIRLAADSVKSSENTSIDLTKLTGLQKPLIPLVRLEIAKILKQEEIIAEALMSKDPELLNRALRTKWFFDSSNTKYINIKYFRENLLPFVAVNTRIKLIKKLVPSFNKKGETELAEGFYTLIANLYGRYQAEPMLEACSEEFIWNEIYVGKVMLRRRIFKNLFYRYPEMMVRYLKLAIPTKNTNLFNFSLKTYEYFWPRLIKSHSADLTEIFEAQGHLYNMYFTKKGMDRFLKTNIDAVIKNPRLYADSMIPIGIIMEKLTNAQYRMMFKNVFPQEVEKYHYYNVEKYLNYCPENERLSLLLETYENVYGASMLDNNSVIPQNIIEKLPVNERARQARIRLQEDDNWRKPFAIETIWRCYLPKDEILPVIESEIMKSSSVEDRSCLLSQWVFISSLDNDSEELLRFLKIFTTRHRDEEPKLIFEVIRSLYCMGRLECQSQEHWNIIEDFLKYLETKNLLRFEVTTTEMITICSVRYRLKNNLPIDEQLKLILDIRVRLSRYSYWWFDDDHPEHDKLCFEKTLEILPIQYPKGHEMWTKHGDEVYRTIVSSIYKINNRITMKSKNSNIKLMSLRDYAWVYEDVKKMITEDEKGPYTICEIIGEILNNEYDIYEEWYPSSSVLEDKNEDAIEGGEAKKLLKKDPAKILTDIDEYFKYIKEYKKFRGDCQEFVKACRWHQDIPIKLLARCFEDLTNENPTNSILILAVLVESPLYTKIIDSILAEHTKSDTSDEKTKKTINRIVITAIARGIKYARPAVSFDLVARILENESVNLNVDSLNGIGRRTSVQKVETFAKKLLESSDSVKKYGIRLYSLVATVSDLRNLLTSLWQVETHKSTRRAIFTTTYRLFIKNPDLESWKMLENCIVNLTLDENEFLNNILKFENFPLSFLSAYVSAIWKSIERFQEQGFDEKSVHDLTEKMFKAISSPMCEILTDDEQSIPKSLHDALLVSDSSK